MCFWCTQVDVVADESSRILTVVPAENLNFQNSSTPSSYQTPPKHFPADPSISHSHFKERTQDGGCNEQHSTSSLHCKTSFASRPSQEESRSEYCKLTMRVTRSKRAAPAVLEQEKDWDGLPEPAKHSVLKQLYVFDWYQLRTVRCHID